MAHAAKKVVPYTPPTWAAGLLAPPGRLHLIPPRYATPIQELTLSHPLGSKSIAVKRDDMTGMEMTGNKLRKLEFLLAEAVATGSDCVVTMGGLQSNHTRATCIAAATQGLPSYIVLRTPDGVEETDPGLVGNLLPSRLAKASIIQVPLSECRRLGSDGVLKAVQEKLVAEGKRPYVIPIGGSNSVGTWGYLECVREIAQQLRDEGLDFTDIAFALGSGGTGAGIALGVHLSGLPVKVHGFSVCDSPEYFQRYIDERIAPGLVPPGGASLPPAKDLMDIEHVAGLGYAASTPVELEFIQSVMCDTGLLLDPVYTGKAMMGLVQKIQERPERFRGDRILFIHTGGIFGVYAKAGELAAVPGIIPPAQSLAQFLSS